MKRRAGRTLWLARGLIYIGLVALAFLAVWRLAVVLAPVGTGLFLAYLFNPLVSRLEARRVPRAAAVALLLALVACVIAVVLLFVPPLLADEVRVFGERWHQYRLRLETAVLPRIRSALHLPAGSTMADTVVNLLGNFSSFLKGASGQLGAAAQGVFATATSLLRILVAVLLTPVFAIYFLMDYPALAAGVSQLWPPRHREQIMGVVGDVNRALASWLRGQLTAMVILATAYAVGLALTGIPLGTGIGILTGLLAFVPYVGVGIGLVLALGACLLDYHGAGPLAGVIATFAVVQTCDTLFITPRVVGGRAGLSPVAVIFALSLGGELLGYAGLLLAVPAAAVCKVLISRARRAYEASAFYDAKTAPAPAPAPEVVSHTPAAEVMATRSPSVPAESPRLSAQGGGSAQGSSPPPPRVIEGGSQ